MKKVNAAATIVLVLTLLAGCTFNKAVKRQYDRVRNTAVGNYYIDTGNYKAGIRSFSATLKENSEDPKAHYYLGRCYLAEDQPKEGLNHLQKAVKLVPGNPDYLFWQGVAYAANNNPKMERKSYLRALAIDDDHLQARCYLGHNQMAAKEYTAALYSYNRVLKHWPTHPQVLYNRGLILKKLGRTPEEITAFRLYLESYTTGAHARKAAYHLNEAGDFGYRNYQVGGRMVTLRKIEFEPFTAILTKESKKTLDFLGNMLVRQRTNSPCQLIYYQKNNLALAEARVKSIKKYLLKKYSRLPARRIRISWFKSAEKIKIGKKVYYQGESVNLFGAR